MNNLKILVVDDSLAARQLYTQCLNALDAQIATAANGKAGLKKALATDFDLIVTDVDMPEMDGITFCKSLKGYPQTRDIPVIIASSFDSEKDIEKGFVAGATAYLSKNEVRSHIVKPFNIDQLVILIERILSDHFILLLKEKERLESERSLLLDSITSLISALEARDAYTKGHSTAVSVIATECLIKKPSKSSGRSRQRSYVPNASIFSSIGSERKKARKVCIRVFPPPREITKPSVTLRKLS